jgi:hypothetical protein
MVLHITFSQQTVENTFGCACIDHPPMIIESWKIGPNQWVKGIWFKFKDLNMDFAGHHNINIKKSKNEFFNPD